MRCFDDSSMRQDISNGAMERNIISDSGIYTILIDVKISSKNMIPIFIIATFLSTHFANTEPVCISKNITQLSSMINTILANIT